MRCKNYLHIRVKLQNKVDKLFLPFDVHAHFGFVHKQNERQTVFNQHRKQHHPSRTGQAKGGTRLAFGDYGIQALESSYLTNRQIEAARIAMTRHIRRGGKVWINVYPDRPLTKKPAETRMGSGKGSPEWWIANVKPGRVLFELSGVNEETAREAMRLAIHKLPFKARFIKREAGEI